MKMHCTPHRRLVVWTASVALLGVATLPTARGALGQESDRADGFRSLPVSQGILGLPGLIGIPIAGTVPVGYVDLGYNTTPDYSVFGPRGLDRQYNVQVSVGLFSRLVISGRGSEVKAIEPRPPFFFQTPDGVIQLIQEDFLNRDLSASVQLLLVKETSRWPGIAIGAKDFGGANSLLEARYGVVSKSLAGRVRLTAGYGWGDDLLKGAFAGVELAPIRQVTLMGEYDADRFNGGLRLRPFPESWVARGVPQPTLDVVWAEGERATWGVSLQVVLDQDWIALERLRVEAGRSAIPAAAGSGSETVERVALALVADGFENVEVSIHDEDLLRVEYENRRYNQHELDGLGRVLRTLSATVPSRISNLQIVLKQTNLEALQIDLQREDLRGFLAGRLAPAVFQDRVSIRYPDVSPSPSGAVSRTGNSSFFKADLTLYPAIDTNAFWDFGVIDGRISLLPNLRVALFRGTSLEAQYRVPLGQTDRYHFTAGELPDPELDRALVHHAQWWSLSERTALVTQWSVGRFDVDNVGVRQEAALSLVGGLIKLGVDVAVLGDDRHDLDRVFALGSARLLIPPVDTRLEVTAGRYLDEDDGVTVDVSRFFADTEIGVFLNHSGRGSLAGLRFAVPLTLGRDLPASRFRVRTPEEWTHAQRSVVFADVNVLRQDVARRLPTRYGIDHAYLDRDRLHPSVVGAELTDPRFWR